MELARHRLVWLDMSRSERLRFLNGDDRSVALAWLEHRPAVVRASAFGGTDVVALGIPLPARQGRRKISFSAPLDSVRTTAPMPRLRDALGAAPADWVKSAGIICSDLEACGAEVRVYGSLGWQHLTGEDYLRPESDLDLLIEPGAGFNFAAALRVFRRLAPLAAPRIDGELLIGADEAVAWREIDAPSAELLVRRRAGPRLSARSDIVRGLTPAVAA